MNKQIERGEDTVQKVAAYETQAKRLISTYCCLVSETEKDDAIIQAMNNCGVGQLKTENLGGHIGVLHDRKSAGEASAQPNIRIPALRDQGDHLRKLSKIKLRAGGDESSIPDREMRFIPDAGKTGDKPTLLSALAGCEKVLAS